LVTVTAQKGKKPDRTGLSSTIQNNTTMRARLTCRSEMGFTMKKINLVNKNASVPCTLELPLLLLLLLISVVVHGCG